MNSLALLGGSFDPIHSGHLHLAREILASDLVGGVVFLPNACHNFKRNRVVLDFPARFALVRDALEPGMETWDDDAVGSGYTADLLQGLYQKYPGRSFFWVIGSDNLPGLPRWHDFRWLKENARFLIIPRPGYPLPPEILDQIEHRVLDCAPSSVSFTLVRQRIAEGKSLRGLVPPRLQRRIIRLYAPLLRPANS